MDFKERNKNQHIQSDTSIQALGEKNEVQLAQTAEQELKTGRDHGDSEPLRKRPKVSEVGAKTTVASSDESSIPLVDVWSHPPLSLKKITRIEVKWDLIPDEQTPNQNAESAHNSKVSRWWGANLLPHDGTSFHILRADPEDEEEENSENHKTINRDKSNSPQKITNYDSAIKAPIRILDYDPYPDGGFPERDISSVIFLNQHSLMDVNNLQSLWFRIEGSDWDEDMPDEEIRTKQESGGLANINQIDSRTIPLAGEDGLRNILDTVLETAMKKSGIQHKMMNMPAAQQCFMADRIVKAKERMLRKLMSANTEKGIEEITPEHVRKCMEEIGTEGL